MGNLASERIQTFQETCIPHQRINASISKAYHIAQSRIGKREATGTRHSTGHIRYTVMQHTLNKINRVTMDSRLGGKITHPGVAAAFNLEYVDPAIALEAMRQPIL